MKKLLILLAIVGCSFTTTYYATTWAGTASNQMVTRQALADAVTNGVFTANESFTADSRLVTKAMAQQYVNISTISGYAINQLVPKSVFTSAVNYYAHDIGNLFWGDGTSGVTTSANALTYLSTATVGGTSGGGGCSYYKAAIYSTYSRQLDVGDEIFSSASSAAYPVFMTGASSCTNVSSGYWIYDFEQNAALEVTNANSGRQYIISKVFPSGTTNVTICIEVTYLNSTQVSVRAYANAAVSTTVSVPYTYNLNGTSGTGTLSISSGDQYSTSTTITNGSSISVFEIAPDSFSPASNGTQNYVSGGQCS